MEMTEEERQLRLAITCMIPEELAVTVEHIREFADDVIKELNDIEENADRDYADDFEFALNINIKARENLLRGIQI